MTVRKKKKEKEKKRKKYPCSREKLFWNFQEKNHPREGDGKKTKTPNFLPPPWKSNGASLALN